MIFLFVLAGATATSAIVTNAKHRFTLRKAARLGMAIALIFAGVSHLFLSTPFIQHLPTWVPLRAEIVFGTGLLEIALGIALFMARSSLRRVGVVLALYLVAVFPGNLYVAFSHVEVDGQPGGIYPWIRLPLQLLFIAWALWSTREATPPVTTDPPSIPRPAVDLKPNSAETTIAEAAAPTDAPQRRVGDLQSRVTNS